MSLSEIKNVQDFTNMIVSDLSLFESEFESLTSDIFEFVGVNFDELVRVLVAKAGDKKRLMNDISILIMVSQMRGANFSKILERIGADGKARLTTLISKYGFVPHSKNVPISQPTIPRVLSLFPQVIFAYRKKYISDPKRISVLGTVPKGLPRELCFPGGSAMIKADDNALLDLWVQWYKSFCTFVKMKNIPTDEQIMIPHRLSRVKDEDRYEPI